MLYTLEEKAVVVSLQEFQALKIPVNKLVEQIKPRINFEIQRNTILCCIPTNTFTAINRSINYINLIFHSSEHGLKFYLKLKAKEETFLLFTSEQSQLLYEIIGDSYLNCIKEYEISTDLTSAILSSAGTLIQEISSKKVLNI